MSKNVVVYIEPENVNAAIGAAVLDVCERTFHELVRRGEIRKIPIPGMRRTTYSLREIRELAARWRADSITPIGCSLRHGPAGQKGRPSAKKAGA